MSRLQDHPRAQNPPELPSYPRANVTPAIASGDNSIISANMTNKSQRGAVGRLWLKVFPGHNKRLALHVIEYEGFPNGMLVQPKKMAVLD